jgi:hypothetical protein
MGERACIYCKRPEDLVGRNAKGMFAVELRPYGPGGALVCFECAMHPEHREETERAFKARLDAAGDVAILTDEGPAPGREFIRDLGKPPKERA